LALQALYGLDVAGQLGSGRVEDFWREFSDDGVSRHFAEELTTGVLDHRAELDNRIEQASKNWTLGRMSKVDLNILRLAVYELSFRTDIPTNVTINEAIEVAKKFGSEESPAFINGILDEIAKGMPRVN
jgi:N utilization substance protein B